MKSGISNLYHATTLLTTTDMCGVACSFNCIYVVCSLCSTCCVHKWHVLCREYLSGSLRKPSRACCPRGVWVTGFLPTSKCSRAPSTPMMHSRLWTSPAESTRSSMEHQQQHNSGCLNTAGVITLWMRARFTKCSELQRITAPQQVRLIMACDNAGASYANGMYHQILKFILCSACFNSVHTAPFYRNCDAAWMTPNSSVALSRTLFGPGVTHVALFSSNCKPQTCKQPLLLN